MKKLNIILLAAASLLSLGASAQSFRSGYFLDNDVYGYRINPAQVNEKSFLSIGLGNIDLQNRANFGVGTFLFPTDNGSIVTGLNKAVSADTFLGGLKENNFLDLDESINILSFGIANGERMHTVELNLRIQGTVNLPYDLFSFAKKGGAGTFNIGGLFANVNTIADLAYGYSMNITDNLSVGGRLHALLGVVNVNLNTNGSALTLSDSRITVNPDVDLLVSGPLSVSTDADGSIDLNSIAADTKQIVGGFGASLDLGVEYKSDFGLDAMISVTDLGIMSWKNTIAANAAGAFDYSGGNISFDGGEMKTDFEQILDVSKIFSFNVTQGPSSISMLPFNIAAGARYFMPFYDKLSVGALATYHNARYASWFDARVGATISPLRLVSFSSNIGYGTFGPVWGAALNLNLGPINMIAGLDSFIGDLGKISNIPVPLGAFTENAHVGISIVF